MEIIIGKTAGFCFGVSNAITKTEELLNRKKQIYCLGELVHNKQVIQELQDSGLINIINIEEAKENVIIRAHGELKSTYQKAQNLGLNIFDLTCPKVLKIHNIAEEYAKQGYFILLIGQKSHPEVIGIMSYCGENSYIIEEKENIESALIKFYNSNIDKLLILSQTTYNIEKFNDIVEIIKKDIENKGIKLELRNTICNATKLRQEETIDIAKKVDFMIIVGGKHSSNTTKLYQLSSKYCKNCILIETHDELNLTSIAKFNKIGIMAGASTPKKSIDKVVEKLKAYQYNL